jgi:SAM-dependent methyltransferase
VDILAVIGTAAGVIGAIGVPIAYLQLRTERGQLRTERAIERGHAAASDGALVAGFGESTLFAPSARYRGFDVGMVDRRSATATLVRHVKASRSVITIEGAMGIGKTTLAAHVCGQVTDREVRWVFCDEQPTAVTLTTLARALADTCDPSHATRIRAALERRAGTSELVDAVVDLLAACRVLLVLDNFHVVTDTGLHTLLARLEHSATTSSVLLTSRTRIRSLHAVPLVGQVELPGLSAQDASRLLRLRDVALSATAARTVWDRAGRGNPLALVLFAGRARTITAPEDLMANLPDPTDDLNEWVAPVFADLPADTLWLAKIIAFAYGPVSRDVLTAVAHRLDVDTALAELTSRFLVTDHRAPEMHSAVRDHVTDLTTAAELADLARRFTECYGEQAHGVFLDGLGMDEPSYGLLYLESFPDYVAAVPRHVRFVDDLLDRLSDNGLALNTGDRILVLGAGDGTHDPGFANHGLVVTNVDIQPEIADLGLRKARGLPVDISYVVADMTTPLRADLADFSRRAVFNIGSSFGYESDDEANTMVFQNAANALCDGGAFVFEFVNGPHWTNRRVRRQVDVTRLPNGATREEVSITNPEAGTSLTMIGLRRPDGTGGWFRHFMRYYRLAEIVALLARAGLRPVATYGARDGRVTGEPFDERESEAMVVIAVPDRK